MLISAVQQSESALCAHISLPLGALSHHSLPSYFILPSHSICPSHSSRSSRRPELSFLCCSAASHKLSVLHMAVHLCHSQFPDSSHPSIPTLPECAHLFSKSASSFISTIFLDCSEQSLACSRASFCLAGILPPLAYTTHTYTLPNSQAQWSLNPGWSCDKAQSRTLPHPSAKYCLFKSFSVLPGRNTETVMCYQ